MAESDPAESAKPASYVKFSALQWIKDHAELLGSRGWARMNGRPEPDSDYDYCFFTDDNEKLWEYRQLLLRVVKEEQGWEARELGDGNLLITSEQIDVSVHPAIKREELLIAYRMRDAGITKAQMCMLLTEMVNLRAKQTVKHVAQLEDLYGSALLRLQELGEKEVTLTPLAKRFADLERERDAAIKLLRNIRDHGGLYWPSTISAFLDAQKSDTVCEWCGGDGKEHQVDANFERAPCDDPCHSCGGTGKGECRQRKANSEKTCHTCLGHDGCRIHESDSGNDDPCNNYWIAW